MQRKMKQRNCRTSPRVSRRVKYTSSARVSVSLPACLFVPLRSLSLSPLSPSPVPAERQDERQDETQDERHDETQAETQDARHDETQDERQDETQDETQDKATR
ncbi:unnamed protein product [Lampetra fluviatilis]